MEIERKFRVAKEPLQRASRGLRIEQGYLVALEDEEVRIRRKNGACTLTAKSGSGLVRGEQEIEISEAVFEALWPFTDGRRVRKTRSELQLNDVTVEIDTYDGHLAGLIIAEVEFASEEAAESFRPPAWMGVEVTGEPAYSNRVLAEKGLP